MAAANEPSASAGRAVQPGISFPAQGSKERKALMDGVRRYETDAKLVFLVHTAVVQGSTALVDVEPTRESDNGVFGGRRWVALDAGADGKWVVREKSEPFGRDTAEAQRRWPSASRELIDAFFGSGSLGTAVAAPGTGTRDIEDLLLADLKDGVVFAIGWKPLHVVYQNGGRGDRLNAIAHLHDDSTIEVNSDEVPAGQYARGERVLVRVVRVRTDSAETHRSWPVVEVAVEAAR